MCQSLGRKIFGPKIAVLKGIFEAEFKISRNLVKCVNLWETTVHELQLAELNESETFYGNPDILLFYEMKSEYNLWKANNQARAIFFS